VLYSDIRTNFDHLDGYLTLFTPLTRRLHRTKVHVTGSAIFHFVTDLFADRLARHEIEMNATESFKRHTVFGYPSSFYPCFVNLIDNSIYWLSDWNGTKEITLDATETGFVVADTGPGIKPRDAQFVFDLGFTRKPGGQGMGLYVCKKTLNQIGFDLVLDDYEKGMGTRFRLVEAEG
jgi:signal transduction histidine kinase